MTPSALDDLFSKITRGRVVPFIGAGASVDAGGPKTDELINTIKRTFPSATYQGNDFMQTCTDAIETSYTDRSDLDKVVIKQLSNLHTSDFYKQIPLHEWPAIFTTNYDDLIEQGYRVTDNRLQTPDPVFNDQDNLNLSDKEKIKIFKLMGCIASGSPHNKLVLTRADYNEALRSRHNVFRTLSDLMMDGTILYIGYSFGDNLLLDILNDLLKQMGDKLPYSYALFPGIDMQSIQAIKLSERKIIPLNMTAAQLAGYLKTGVQSRLIPVQDREGVHVVVKGQHKTISHSDFRLYSQSFDFIFEEKLNEGKPDDIETRRDFFRGLANDLTGYVRGWDFTRSQYKDIFGQVQANIEDADVGNNRSLLICGPAGSGKTLMLSRIAVDTYRKLGNPVIFLRSYYDELDLKLLVSLCEELTSIEKPKRPKRVVANARVLIIMESASAHVTDFKIIPIIMKSRGIPVLLLGSARENEWQMACGQINEKYPDQDVFRLSDKFASESERNSFAEHLNKLGLVNGDLGTNEIVRLIETNYENSFFASVYSLIEPARPTLDDKILQEYKNLSALAQKAYIFVSSFYQYGIPMPLTLLVRALGCSYDQFIEEIFETEAKRIICDVDAPLEGVFLGARHRIVAERMVEKQMPPPDGIVNILTEVLSNLNKSNGDEVHVCRTLLIKHIGPNGTERRFSSENVRGIFKAAVDAGKFEDSAVLHHYGIFESEDGNQEEALKLLSRAIKQLEVKQNAIFLRNERIENIYNTMGMIYSKKARIAEDEGQIDDAERCYAAATDFFSKAKAGELQTPHPYGAECRMHFLRGDKVVDQKTKIILYLRALDVVEEAQDNLPEESLSWLLELRAQIMDTIKKMENLDDSITEMEGTTGLEGMAACVKARLVLINPNAAQETRLHSYKIVRQLVTTRKDDVAILRLYSRLHQTLFPEDKKGLYEIQRSRYEIPKEKRNFALLYSLGVLAFTFSEYLKSLGYFKELERISQGHPKRWGIQEIGIDEKDRKKEFQGSVIDREAGNLGYVDMPSIRRRIPFLPNVQRFEPQAGENVKYNVGFNYRGWLAIDLSR
jgi:tetratricopeptide (TPR) repeat protein